MKKPVADYRQFRLRKLNEPQFCHLKLLFGWVIYFALYFLTENLIPPEKCWSAYIPLDDHIPFCEWFLIPYFGWYGLIVFSLVWFGLYNVDGFKRLSKFIFFTQMFAMAVYILFPSRQDLRPAQFPRENALTWAIGLLYRFDTNTGVCPSLHVGYSLGIASVWLKERQASLAAKIVVVVFVVLVCLSTMFIKQHSALDVLAALPMCLLAELVVYRDRYFPQKAKKGCQD